MKLVEDFTDQNEAINFSLAIRAKGIPNHVAMFRGNNTHRYGGGPKTWAVWVLIDPQFDDAIKLIRNSRHKVKNPLTEEEIFSIEMDLSKNDRRKIIIDSSIFITAFIGLIVFVVSIWLDTNI
jgi:hypothetical protein